MRGGLDNLLLGVARISGGLRLSTFPSKTGGLLLRCGLLCTRLGWRPLWSSRLETAMELYDKGFFEYMHSVSRSSAEETVPVLLELIHPQSVVDVGCGV